MQPRWIELACGPSKGFTALVWTVWMLALGAVLYSAQHYAWPWLVVAAFGLVVLRPKSGLPLQTRCTVRIHTKGSARIGEFEGTWRPVWRANRLAVLLEMSRAGRSQPVLVCASLNRPDDYRHLLVWCRFPRRGTQLSVSVSE